MSTAIRIDPEDNVATALSFLKSGDPVSIKADGKILTGPTVLQDIEFGHKFAIGPIQKGEDIKKYGEVIGRATEHIREGAHVHVHNVESLRGRA